MSKKTFVQGKGDKKNDKCFLQQPLQQWMIARKIGSFVAFYRKLGFQSRTIFYYEGKLASRFRH